jgi:hypothetical protein
VVVVLTENAAGSAIVREEIGLAMGRASLSSSSSRRPSRRSPLRWDAQRAAVHPFDIDEPQEGLVKLTDWVNLFAAPGRKSFTKPS